LAKFVSGEVQSVMSDVERLRRKWTFQLGPLAEHTIEIKALYSLQGYHPSRGWRGFSGVRPFRNLL